MCIRDRGLHSERFDKRIPGDYRLRIYSDLDVGIYPETLSVQLSELTELIRTGEHIVIKNGVFEYWCHQVFEDLNTSAWILCFFNTVHFLVLNLHEGVRPNAG